MFLSLCTFSESSTVLRLIFSLLIKRLFHRGNSLVDAVFVLHG